MTVTCKNTLIEKARVVTISKIKNHLYFTRHKFPHFEYEKNYEHNFIK